MHRVCCDRELSAVSVQFTEHIPSEPVCCLLNCQSVSLPQTAWFLLPFLPVTLPVDYSEFDHCAVRDVWFEMCLFLTLERLKLVSGQ